MSKNKSLPSKAEIAHFEMLFPMLVAVLNELRELSKKKQDGVLNKLKAKTVNKFLERIKLILANEPTIEFLELLDEETLPTNSDAVLIIVQFESAMEQFKRKYYTKDSNWKSSWKTRD
jgi:hypothetical protein